MSEARGARLPDDCFALPPGVDWTPVDTALAALAARLTPIAAIETVPLAQADGRVLAGDLMARRAHPAADNSAVDGYAFRYPEGASRGEKLTFELAEGRSAAGAPHGAPLTPGTALRVLTGAPMPDGADTVVLQEDVTQSGAQLSFPAPATPGSNRRRAGENLTPGAVALPSGLRLSPQALAQAAAAGHAALPVRRSLTVALLSTGDELISPENAGTARADQIIDSNRPMLAAMLRRLGITVRDLGVVPDVAGKTATALSKAAGSADAVLVSGGASGGDEDHVAAYLAKGADRSFHLWRIAMKPGRPMAMGQLAGKPVFALPGNPVAAFVCAALFVAPALRRLSGEPWRLPQPIMVESGFDYPKKPGRREYLRVRLGSDGRLQKYRSEGSGLIEGLVWSDGLADLAHDAGPLRAGDRVAYLPYAALGLAP